MLFGNRRPRIKRKSAEDIDGMRKAGKLASQCLQEIAEQVAPGMTTQDIDDLQMDFAKRHGVELAQLNYGGSRHVSPFPKSICTSIDEVICHGIPSDRELKEGETVGLDVTIVVDGYYGDNATTIAVGEIDEDGKRLLDVTLESLRRGIQAVRPGGFLGDIGFAIQSYAEAEGFSVVRDFVGHGIGTEFHEEPQVPHYGKKGRGTRLAPGMTFTIEPMINEGTWRSKVLEDGWTAVTADGKRSAQYEHTIAVTKDGVEIMTVQNDDGSWEPRDESRTGARSQSCESRCFYGFIARRMSRPGIQKQTGPGDCHRTSLAARRLEVLGEVRRGMTPGTELQDTPLTGAPL